MIKSVPIADVTGTEPANDPTEDSHTGDLLLCSKCYRDEIPIGRWLLGYRTCLVCGDKAARAVKHTIVPVPKSNYIYAHTLDDVLSPYSHKGNR